MRNLWKYQVRRDYVKEVRQNVVLIQTQLNGKKVRSMHRSNDVRQRIIFFQFRNFEHTPKVAWVRWDVSCPSMQSRAFRTESVCTSFMFENLIKIEKSM